MATYSSPAADGIFLLLADIVISKSSPTSSSCMPNVGLVLFNCALDEKDDIDVVNGAD